MTGTRPARGRVRPARGPKPGRGPRSPVWKPLLVVLLVPFAASGIVLLAGALQSPPACTPLGPAIVGKQSFDAPPCRFIARDSKYIAILDTSAGEVTLQLEPRLADDTVNNFVFLALAGFYDGMRIHRVESDEEHAFVQMGDPGGTGRGNAGYEIEAETPSPLARYVRGVVAMAKRVDRDVVGSQFFIVVRDYADIGENPRDPFFGIVANQNSLAVLDQVAEAPLDEDGRPLEDVVVRSVRMLEDPLADDEGPRPIPLVQPTDLPDWP
ncbi:MAG TPA: peptidylprolyl isomerase [Actinomycetota bacterium]